MTPAEIKSLRHALNLSTSQTGELLGVSKRTVESWECGRFKPNPSALKMLLELCHEHDIYPGAIYKENGTLMCRKHSCPARQCECWKDVP